MNLRTNHRNHQLVKHFIVEQRDFRCYYMLHFSVNFTLLLLTLVIEIISDTNFKVIYCDK